MFTFEIFLVSIITSCVENLVKSRVTHTATKILQEISDASYILGTSYCSMYQRADGSSSCSSSHPIIKKSSLRENLWKQRTDCKVATAS